MTNPATHTLEDVLCYLADLTERGIVGTMEVSLHGHDITNIRHIENHRPGALPKPSAALRIVSA